MIKKAAECTIRVFMAALFNRDFTQVMEEDFESIYTEYIDLSGIGETKEKDLLTTIHNIQIRLITIPAMIDFQAKYFGEFKEPYWDGFWFFKKHGHRLTWDISNPGLFLKQIELIEIKERKYYAELDKFQKELADLQKDGVKPDGDGRKEFIHTLNRIGKHRRNDIDRDKVDVETYALMIKDYSDEINNSKKE